MSNIEFKGTKGNWSVGRDHNWIISDTTETEGFPIRSGHTDVDYYGGMLICESIWKKEDANLLAASKDLLEALQEIIPFAKEWINENHPVMIKAESAIKKALGNGK